MQPEVHAAVKRLEPWWFRFELNGEAFGGQAQRDVEKVSTFFEWVGRCGGKMGTILELGSHEGSHSLQLAERPEIVRVVGLEGRDDNLARARLVQRAYGATNVEFRRCDLEHFDPVAHGSFDAIFCAGLLYHLPEPWKLLAQLGDIGRFLFLDTHYSASDEVAVGRYRGRWYAEGVDALSGLSERAFWLTFKHLTMQLLETGFVVRFVRDFEYTINGPRVWILAERTTETGSVWPSQELELRRPTCVESDGGVDQKPGETHVGDRSSGFISLLRRRLRERGTSGS